MSTPDGSINIAGVITTAGTLGSGRMGLSQVLAEMDVKTPGITLPAGATGVTLPLNF